MPETKPHNPFPGLRPFESDEDYLFFGRDGQSTELLRRLSAHRFLAVIGTSGSGKSSLVRAGLLPVLHGGFMKDVGSAWRVTLFRPGNDPTGNLAAALHTPQALGVGDGDVQTQKAITETTLRRSALGLVDVIRQARLPEGENLLIVVDQFEEIFRFKQGANENSGDEAAAFVKLLLEATRQKEPPIYIVITMRSDFLGDCAQFHDLPEAINKGQYLIPRMTRDQRREAITSPIAVSGATIAPRLVNRLLNDVGDNPDQLPILQHALMRTWQCWAIENRCDEPIDFHHYEAIGGMAEALSNHADKAYNDLPDERLKEVAKRLFQCLTERTVNGREVRRPATVRDICAVAGAREEEVFAVAENFRREGRSFLMPPSKVPLRAETLIDISHESLIRGWKRLKEWVEEEALSASIYHRLAETAVLHREGKARLWEDPDLQIALTWREKNLPNAVWAERYHPEFKTAMDFLDESREAVTEKTQNEEKQRIRNLRRTQFFAVFLGLAALASLAFGSYANKQRARAQLATVEAREQKEIANSQTLIAHQRLAETEKARREAEEAKITAERAETAALEAADRAQKAEEDAKRAAEAVKQSYAKLQVQTLAAEKARYDAERNLKIVKVTANAYLRTRSQYIDTLSTTSSALNSFIQTLPPRASIPWRQIRANLLSSSGEFEAAEDELSAVLEIEPGNPKSRLSRGYMYSITGNKDKVLQSLEDLKQYLAIDPNSAVAYQNLGVSYGMLKRYDDAFKATDQAIKMYKPSGNETATLSDSRVSGDIKNATTLSEIVVNEHEFLAALYYQLANIKSYMGKSDDFVKELEEADKFVKSIEKAAMRDPPPHIYLAALNWSWLHSDSVPDDYGALVSQGALWERAKFEDEAMDSYETFLQEYRRRPDSRYDGLAKYAHERIKKLTAMGVKITRASALNSVASAKKKVSDEESADSVSPIRLRAPRVNMEKTLEGMGINPKGISMDAWDKIQGRKNKLSTVSAETSEAELRKALEEEPTNGTAMYYLSKLLEERKPEESWGLLEQNIKVWPHDANLYQRKARLELSLKQFDKSLNSIQTAISLQGDELSLYDDRKEIEDALGKDGAESVRNQADGYNEAASAALKVGKAGQALNIYVKSLRILAAHAAESGDQSLRYDMVTTMHKLARLIELQSSKEKAIEFLHAEFSETPALKDILQIEIERFSPSAKHTPDSVRK
jgi:hypothetical protein